MMKKYSILIVVVSLLTFGCEDKNKVAEAQACLDGVQAGNTEQAVTCVNLVDGVDSQQADIIRCAGWLMAGGLTTQKMVNAYKALSGTTGAGAAVTNKEAVFISTMVLDQRNAVEGYSRAQKGDGFCQKTGVKGLMYISGLAVTGTLLSRVAADAGAAFSDPPTEAEVNGAIDNCLGGTPSSLCSPATVGAVANTIATSYCAASSADEGVCKDVNNAIAASGGDTTKMGNALLCLLKKGTYDPIGDTCT